MMQSTFSWQGVGCAYKGFKKWPIGVDHQLAPRYSVFPLPGLWPTAGRFFGLVAPHPR